MIHTPSMATPIVRLVVLLGDGVGFSVTITQSAELNELRTAGQLGSIARVTAATGIDGVTLFAVNGLTLLLLNCINVQCNGMNKALHKRI